MKTAIRTSRLTKKFGPRAAVADINLNVPAGSIFGFVGPNGAGKTTTVRMLTGLARPSSGQGWIHDVEVPSGWSRVAPHVGCLLESPGFYPPLSGYENLRLLALDSGELIPRAHLYRVLSQVNLADRAGDPVRQYSQGMRQRLGLAVALLKDPDLLILDEPLTGLDPVGIRETRDLILGFRRQGKTVFLSSHLLSEVERVCDWIAMIGRGRLLAQGPLVDVLTAVRIEGADHTGIRRVLARQQGVTVTADGESLLVRGASMSGLESTLLHEGIHSAKCTEVRGSLEDVFFGLADPAREQ